MTPDSGSPWSYERYQVIKDTFTQTITKTRDAEVNCLSTSGDLLHHQPLARDLKEISYSFTTIPSVRITVTAGNHNWIRTNSAPLSFAWTSDVTFIMSEEMVSIYFEDINTETHGFSHHTMDVKENRIEDIKAPEDGRVHILMVHGGDATHLPFGRRSLTEAGFSYAALGHVHKPEIIAEGRTTYPGSPESLDEAGTGPHGVLLGEVNSATLKPESLNFVPLSKSQYIPLAVNITPSTTSTKLDLHTFQEIEKHRRQNLYRFRARGMRDPGLTFNFENLETRYRVVGVLDETEPQYDFGALLAEHPGNVIGFHVRTLQEPEMSPMEKEALYYGIDALLHTTDERSQP